MSHGRELNPPSPERIRAFKALINLVAERVGAGTEKQKSILSLGAALCFALGCGCPAAEGFETMILEWTEKLIEEGVVVDEAGNPVDLLQALARGIE